MFNILVMLKEPAIRNVKSPVYTTQPVVKPIVKAVWQPDVSCKRSIRLLIHV